MKERREYHEIYGYLPQEFINKFSEIEKRLLFADWMMRRPTATGWFIVRTVIAALGDNFINYLLKGIVESLEDDETPVTKEILIDNLQTLLEGFATDTNTFEEYVRLYREEELGLDDDVIEDEEDMKSTDHQCNKQKRDAKGRFIKS